MRAEGERIVLDPGDLDRFQHLAASLPVPEPYAPGRWLEEEPEGLWLELVSQLLVVGGRMPIERMRDNGEIELLSLPKVLSRAAAGKQEAERHVHGVLARNGVRYVSDASGVSRKARQVVAAALSPALVRGGKFQLHDLLLPCLPEPPTWSRGSRQRERAARHLLVRSVEGFGMKSASDFLNHLGASQNLLAFDSRLQTVLRDGFGLDHSVQRRFVSHPQRYEALEGPLVDEVCPRLGVCPAVLYELMFRIWQQARDLLHNC
ncbi:MAG: hypothetical protein M3P51_11580 [Chloroflexota bacterium]|nr:hypothetical protein [Chloroflexota bacterium]